MSKKFVINEGVREDVPRMLELSVDKHLKNDGFDDLRRKIWHEKITEGEFKNGLLDLERFIEFKKKGNEVSLDCTFNKPGNGPLEDRIIIWPDKSEQVTGGGIYIPETQQSRPAIGTVISVGPGMPNRMHNKLIGYHKNGTIQDEFAEDATPVYELMAMPLKPGHKVLFGRLAGLPIRDPETGVEGFLIMRLSDVFVKI